MTSADPPNKTCTKIRKKASLACTNCRTRKIKCNVAERSPCDHCTKLDIECVLLHQDRRKDRFRTEHMNSLEQKLARYEEIFRKIKENHTSMAALLDSLEGVQEPAVKPEKIDAQATPQMLQPNLLPISTPLLMKTINTPRSRVATPESPHTHEKALPTRVTGLMKATNIANDGRYSVLVYGPTSVYNTESVSQKDDPQFAPSDSLCGDPVIVECIQLFFRWQYPDMHLFVFREAFLLDFFNPYSGNVYASNQLVYAVCAVGSLVLEDERIREMAQEFYRKSHLLLMQNLELPLVSSLQAFLLLGLFDVYNGRNNSGWMLTGDGLRMGFGIGFHLSTENWSVGKNEQVSHITISVRLRIFWGSFMADRFLGLILGRPSILKMDDSTIAESINMPGIETIADYTYPGTKDYGRANYIDISNPLKAVITLVSISDAMLKELFSKPAHGKEKKMTQNKVELLKRYNEKILDWRQKLVLILQWDRSTLANFGHDHTKMFMRYFYYIVLLCLNRPFVEVSKSEASSEESGNALRICESAIDDLHLAMLSFVKNHGFNRCLILIVYLCIISISIILLTTSGGNLSARPKFEEYFFDFMTLLNLSSKTWKLSEISYWKVRATMQSEFKLNYEAELSKFLQRKQDLRDPFLLHGNSLISISGEAHEDLSPELTRNFSDNEFKNMMEFGGFGGPPVFMNADLSEWGNFFPEMAREREN